MQNIIFAVHDVSLSRGGRQILDGVSFEMKSGDVVLLRGPNGAGKTTLLRAFAGLLQPDCGGVFCRDASSGAALEDPSALTVFCSALNAHKAALSVDENLKFWAALYGAPESRIGLAKSAFGLDHYSDYLAGILSTGLARRLGLARLVLAARPIWLIDEPTVALDAKSTTAFLDQVSAHREGGGLTIIATHDALEISGARSFELKSSGAAA